MQEKIQGQSQCKAGVIKNMIRKLKKIDLKIINEYKKDCERSRHLIIITSFCHPYWNSHFIQKGILNSANYVIGIQITIIIKKRV